MSMKLVLCCKSVCVGSRIWLECVWLRFAARMPATLHGELHLHQGALGSAAWDFGLRLASSTGLGF